MAHQPLSVYSLAFKDYDLESRYHSDQLKSTFMPIDRSLCSGKLTLTVFLVASYLLGVMPANPTAANFWFLYLSVLWIQHNVMQHLPNFYASKRHWLVLVFKVSLAGCLMGFVPTFVFEPIYSWGTFGKVLVMGAGLVLMNCTGVCMPIFWRHHMLHAAAVFIVYTSTMLPALIDTLMCTPTSRILVHKLYTAADTTAYQMGGLVFPLCDDKPVDAAPRAQAYTVVLWLQVYFGLLVPAVYLYYYELRSRTAFVRQLAISPHVEANDSHTLTASDGHAPLPTTPSTGLSSQPVLILTAVMVLLGVVLWNVLHLASGQLMPWFDNLPTAAWMDAVAQPFDVGSCIGVDRNL